MIHLFSGKKGSYNLKTTICIVTGHFSVVQKISRIQKYDTQNPTLKLGMCSVHCESPCIHNMYYLYAHRIVKI